jgi:hypothetical protein
MFFVEKFDVKTHRWRLLNRFYHRESATELCFTLSHDHPDQAYRLIVARKDTLKLLCPTLLYRHGQLVETMRRRT